MPHHPDLNRHKQHKNTRTRNTAMRTTFVALTWIFFSLSATLLMSQEGRGTIGGRVLDPTGAVIAGADVKVLNKQTGVAAAGKTNDSGIYSIPYLLPGTYTITAELTGFKTTERPGVDVRVGDVLNVDLQMQVGNTTESVEVSAAAPLLESENVSLGQVIDTRRIDDLPLQAGN